MCTVTVHYNVQCHICTVHEYSNCALHYILCTGVMYMYKVSPHLSPPLSGPKNRLYDRAQFVRPLRSALAIAVLLPSAQHLCTLHWTIQHSTVLYWTILQEQEKWFSSFKTFSKYVFSIFRDNPLPQAPAHTSTTYSYRLTWQYPSMHGPLLIPIFVPLHRDHLTPSSWLHSV